MATPAQITANRANAQKSTGPRSVEGKSVSHFNALKHGIDAASIVIPGEDPADYDALAAHYLPEYRPQSASEFFHVDSMLRADWHKRRLQHVEADLYRTVLAESPGNPLAAVLLAESPAAKLLIRVQRQIAGFERTWHRANNELRRARAESEPTEEGSFDKYLDFLSARPAPTELASFREWQKAPPCAGGAGAPPANPSEARTPPPSPPTDKDTGRPLYFVG